MKMPFGKHKGEQIHLLEKSYLHWLRDNCKLHGDLLNAVDAALQGKAYTPPAKVKKQPGGDVSAIIDKMLENSWES